MKRRSHLIGAALFLGILIPLGAGPPMPFVDPAVEMAEAVMNDWQSAMRNLDVDALAARYWEDALRVLVFPGGGRHMIEGREAIAEHQAATFRQARREDPRAFRGFTLPGPYPVFVPGRFPLLIYRPDGMEPVQVFHFEERFGRVAISRQVEFVRELEPVEASEGYAWADVNLDGILDSAEQQRVVDQHRRLASGPHPAEGLLDSSFDWDGSGHIDQTESERALTALFRDGLRRGYRWFPEFTEMYLDLDSSGAVTLHEADLAVTTAFRSEREIPYPVETPLDHRMDVDLDGWIIHPEKEAFVTMLIRAVASVPSPPFMTPDSPDGPEWAFLWADANESGELEEPELRDIATILLRIVGDTEVVSNPIEQRYDRNRDFIISPEERERAREELLGFLPGPEREEIAHALEDPMRLVGRRPGTEIQRQMDNDPPDGRLDEHEVVSFLEGAFIMVAESWLGVPGGDDAVTHAPVDRGAAQEPEVIVQPDGGSVASRLRAAAPTSAVPADQVGKDISVAVMLNPVYPVLRKYYDTAPLGSVTITNTSAVDLSNLEVSLSLAKYIDQARTYSRVDSLAAGESARVDLTLLFNSTVLDITEGDRVDATVTVSYSGAAGRAEETATQTMIFYDRNAIRWDDTRKVAAFVTVRDEEIRSYARRAIAAVRDSRSSAVDDAFQDAMALFIAMVESDVMYFHDPASSYASASSSGVTIDYLQFPRQTLTDFGGDCDDLSVCYNALLESVGRSTAFITVPGHIMPAVALTMSAAEARSAFMDPTDLVFDQDGTVWVPVEITALESSFYEAWQEGAKKYRQYSGSGQAEIIPTATAWTVFESVASVVDDPVEQADRSSIGTEFAKALSQFITVQIAGRELALLADLEDSPGDCRLLNRLGVLYAQYGVTDKAKTQFEAAVAGEQYVPALLNLGHIAFLEGEYRTSVDCYEDVLEQQPTHAGALLAAARAHYELENMGNVRTYYEQLRTASPRLAADYSYLDLSSSNETARAQAAGQVKNRVIWENSAEE